MKIGIDVDGVLTDLESYQLKYGKKYFKDVTDINEDGYDICDIFHCSRAEREKFWTKYIWGYCLTDPLREYCVEEINKLKAAGHEIHIITGRAHTTEKGFLGDLFRKMLVKRLEKEEIPYDSITYCSEDGSAVEKVEICNNLHIDVMLEDKVENILALHDKIPVICFNARYNKDLSGENIFRVDNFSDAYDTIERLSKENHEDSIFNFATQDEISQMTNQEKISYYKKMRDFYKSLPYDSAYRAKQEKRYSAVASIGIPIFNQVFKPVVFNKENIPTDENVIFASNHLNYYDQFQIISAIGNRPIHFLTSTKMLAMKRGVFYKMTGAISVDREDKIDRRNSKEEIIKTLLNGSDVFIFPEGKTNRTNVFLNEFHPGAVAIAKTTGKKIVPIAINDNYSKNSGPLCVRFGEPMTILPTDDIMEKTEELKGNIGLLIFENMEYVQAKEKEKVKVKEK